MVVHPRQGVPGGIPVPEIDPSIFKAALDHVRDGVFLVDTNRRILFWNQVRIA